MIIVLGLLWNSNANSSVKENAKSLGYNFSKVDFNFECSNQTTSNSFGFHKTYSKKLSSDIFIKLPLIKGKYGMADGMVQNFGPQTIQGSKYDVMMVWYQSNYLEEQKLALISKYVVLGRLDQFSLQQVVFTTKKKVHEELKRLLNSYDKKAFKDHQQGLNILLDHHIKARDYSSTNKDKNFLTTYNSTCRVIKGSN